MLLVALVGTALALAALSPHRPEPSSTPASTDGVPAQPQAATTRP